MNILFDPAALRARAQTPHGQTLVREMKEEVAAYRAAFRDDPAADSGWGHAYFCSEDGSFLDFDLASPTGHRCPVCGTVFTGEPYDSCWIYLYRCNTIRSAKLAAVLYQLEPDNAYLIHIKTILGFYATHYEAFADHGRGKHTPSGNGKIMPQALNEATLLTNLVLILMLCGDALGKDFTAMVAEKLLLPAAWFIEEQKHIIHNIPCWINAGIGMVGLYTGEQELIDRAFTLPLGLADQVRQGVTADQFWYEGSIHYNHFTLESFANLLLCAKAYGKEIPADVTATIRDMFSAVFAYAFTGGILPNPNDGWPNLNLKTYTYIYETASAVFDDDALAAAIRSIYLSSDARVPVPLSAPFYSGDYCVEWLLFAREGHATDIPKAVSKNFAASNFAILRGDSLELFFKYGHCSPSHAHPDKMNIEVMAHGRMISRDISNCGYAARLCPEYHRTSVGHNTVTVDGQSHPTTERGEITRYDAAIPAIAAVNKNAYDGVDFARAIIFTADGFHDDFTVTSSTAHNYDWFFHVERDGELLTTLSTAPAALGYTEHGYQHLNEICRVSHDGALTLAWRFPGGLTATQTIEADGMELFLAKSYDNPVSHMRTTLILRAKSASASFRQSWHFETTKG